MKPEPMMPNISVTPLATRVSTKASDGVIFCTPVTAARVLAVADLTRKGFAAGDLSTLMSPRTVIT